MNLQTLPRTWEHPIHEGIFTSINHVIEFSKSIPRSAKKDNSSESSLEAEWSGSKNLPHAYELAQSGYVEEIAALSSGTVHPPVLENPLPNYSFDLAGEQFDVGLFLEGTPEYWITSEMQSNKYVSLVVKIGGSAGISRDELNTFCIQVVGLVKNLMRLGYSVAISAVQLSNISFYTLPVKRYNEYLDIAKLYTILQPSFFRRIFFTLIEQQDNFEYGYGHGNIRLAEKVTEAEGKELFTENYLYLDITDNAAEIIQNLYAKTII